MTQSMITIVAALNPASLVQAQQRIAALGNPARPDIKARLDVLEGESGIHFASLHALASFQPGRAHLVLEFSADGDAPRAIGQIASTMGDALTDVFALAQDWSGSDLAGYLSDHQISTGYAIGAAPGLGHSGSPGMSVGSIRAQAAFFARCRDALASQPAHLSALARLEAVRSRLGDTAPADCANGDAAPAFVPLALPGLIRRGVASFNRTYLWIWWLAVAALAVVYGVKVGSERGAGAGWCAGLCMALIGVSALVLGALAIYVYLRRLENSDWISDRRPDPQTLSEITALENAPGYAHNHMVSVTELKPGWVRNFLVRLVFWAVATLGPLLFKPGYLGLIGTIHFARWVTIPGTRDFLFFSNYGGSWESYLEDFITLSHNGLTGVWSNTVGFPRTVNLIQQGATDGERFKRYARQSMQPSRFWYSAYPSLNTDMIRVNADVCRGFATAMTEDDAKAWVSRFGSAIRPDDQIATGDIQSLLFGGLGFLPHGKVMFYQLPAEVSRARAWLQDVAPHILYSAGRRLSDDERIAGVYQVAFSGSGLTALGLNADGLASFPAAFLDGMDAEHRARILGDTGANDSSHWWWRERADVVLLAYGRADQDLAALDERARNLAAQHGARLVHDIVLQPYARTGNHEPFGFADGISQPLIRGSYKAHKDGTAALHVVEPGEFILGYRDNRGNLPPGPTLDAIHDPGNRLPLVSADASCVTNDVNLARDLGRDGSYLVIRQLEQDVDGFQRYCEDEATRLQPRLGAPYQVDAEFIGAKLIGRWKDGAALVRAPYRPPGTGAHASMTRQGNDFRFGEEDPQGQRCPFGAHIRRSNPRDSLNPGSDTQIDISNRHRILRVGRKYAPGSDQKPGLLFMCLNGDLERQFEFVQQTWINGNVISLTCPMNLEGERDPISSADLVNGGYTIPTLDGNVRLSPLPRFVTLRGGGYYFLAGRALINYLASPVA